MAMRAADWDGYHESPRPNPTKGISRTTTVREPLPSVVVPLVWAAIQAVVGLGMLIDLVLEGLSHDYGWTFGVIVVVLILVTLAFRDNARLYKRRIIEREEIREKNFWRVIDHIIDTPLPSPTTPDPLDELYDGQTTRRTAEDQMYLERRDHMMQRLRKLRQQHELDWNLREH